MSCERIKLLLPDYWDGSLEQNSRVDVDAHLAVCPACREDAGMWAALGAIPEEQPGPALRARFDTMLAAYQHGMEQAERRPGRFALWLESMLAAWWPARPAMQFGVAAMCLIAGGVAGHLITASGARNAEISRLHEELRDTREMVAVSLLQQQSASERLRGVNWSSRIAAPDREVLTALVSALKYDTNVDVRLAAADALRRFSGEPLVRRGIHEALNGKQSPLVQISLIDAVVEFHEQDSVAQLKRLSADSSVNEAVRQRANWAIEQF